MNPSSKYPARLRSSPAIPGPLSPLYQALHDALLHLHVCPLDSLVPLMPQQSVTFSRRPSQTQGQVRTSSDGLPASPSSSFQCLSHCNYLVMILLECQLHEAGVYQFTELGTSLVPSGLKCILLQEARKSCILFPFLPLLPDPLVSCPGILSSKCEKPNLAWGGEPPCELSPFYLPAMG